MFDLPFPYDGSNEHFGGTEAQFRRAAQPTQAGGRINSFFDHLYPLYPAPDEPGVVFGREPATAPTGGLVLPFNGQLSSNTYYSGHPGYDFAPYTSGQATTPVFAAAVGVVAEVGEHESGALYVRLVHTVPDVGQFQSTYWHLAADPFFAAMQGRVGETLPAGERIGTMGNTGWSTGHHLHFEVRFDANGDGRFTGDEVVDPFGFLPGPAYPQDPWAEAANFTDARGETYRHAPVPSRSLWVHSWGTRATVPLDGGGQMGAMGTDGGQTPPISLCAGAGSLPVGSTVYAAWSPDPPYTHEQVGVGSGCALSAFDAQGNAVTRFAPPVRVDLPVDLAALALLTADSAAIYWQETGSEQWARLDTVMDTAAGVASAYTDRPGRCALLGTPAVDMVPP
ncbi:MAG: M23 family metallopeptidase, partial [Anaerolineales bacterium]|nr:M23 family metallopeptidase [Anaerolineales bacterium]